MLRGTAPEGLTASEGLGLVVADGTTDRLDVVEGAAVRLVELLSLLDAEIIYEKSAGFLEREPGGLRITEVHENEGELRRGR